MIRDTDILNHIDDNILTKRKINPTKLFERFLENQYNSLLKLGSQEVSALFSS